MAGLFKKSSHVTATLLVIQLLIVAAITVGVAVAATIVLAAVLVRRAGNRAVSTCRCALPTSPRMAMSPEVKAVELGLFSHGPSPPFYFFEA